MPDVARDATRGLLLVLGAEHVDQRYALDTIAAGAKVSAISMAHFVNAEFAALATRVSQNSRPTWATAAFTAVPTAT